MSYQELAALMNHSVTLESQTSEYHKNWRLLYPKKTIKTYFKGKRFKFNPEEAFLGKFIYRKMD